ncbi:hypothetical protein HK100_006699 [Physocladia obscura]|uniref:HbrB-like protein n=1 Tax=Physocladia obscura TaxID=109957 RepID=A0AAD5SRI3_9FUNG|nr:hypothetical protein HK100_006699 [Physocladia obscura]
MAGFYPAQSAHSAHSIHSLDESSSSAWRSLRAKVLPLFNGEGLRASIEDVNEAVQLWLTESSTSNPTNIRLEIMELVSSGAAILAKKMVVSNDDSLLLPRLLDLWAFFFATVVPCVQGAFVPLNERLVPPVSLSSTLPSSSLSIRSMTLIAFRDQILWPLVNRVETAIPRSFLDIPDKKFPDVSSKCIQMLSVLQSVRSKQIDEKSVKCQQLLVLTRENIKVRESMKS